MPQTGPPFSVPRPRPWQASAGFAHEMVVPPHSTHGVGSVLSPTAELPGNPGKKDSAVDRRRGNDMKSRCS